MSDTKATKATGAGEWQQADHAAAPEATPDDWIAILKAVGNVRDRLSKEEAARAIAAACVFYDLGNDVGEKLIATGFRQQVDALVSSFLVNRGRVLR